MGCAAGLELPCGGLQANGTRRMRTGRWLLAAMVVAVALLGGARAALGTAGTGRAAPDPNPVRRTVPSASNPEVPGTVLTHYLPLVFGPGGYDWPQFGFDAQHSGNNTRETGISAANVASLTVLFKQPLPGTADGAPVYLAGVATASGTRDLVFVTTMDGHIAALDARSGATIWSKAHGPGSCKINNGASPCYTTSSPALDPDRRYVYSYGLDGAVHKHAVGDGSEVLGGGWPEPATLKAYDEKGSSALAVAVARDGTAYLYASQAGYPGDAGDYQGHLTVVNLATGAQRVFNTLCSNQAVHFVDSRVRAGPDCLPQTQSAVWARPGVVYDPLGDRILFATGNGTFDPGQFLWGDTVLALGVDGTGSAGGPLDSWTPADYQALQNGDTDLGSTAPALLPAASGKHPHLVVQGGKDGKLRLLDRDNLSGQGGPGSVGGELSTLAFPPGGEILTQPAVWTNPADGSTWVFVANGAGLAGLQLVVDGAGNPSLVARWTKSGGTSPIVANGVLYIARSGQIAARDPLSGSLLWSASIGNIHWASPIVAGGVLYIADQSGSLTAFSR